MKRCPRCNQTYDDANLNFCLNDGELLRDFSDGPPPTIFGNEERTRFADDAPPTVMMDPTRVTNPMHHPPGGPMTQWQQQPGLQPTAQFGAPVLRQSRDQVLPTVSLVLGVLGFLSVCCWGGIPFGAAALVTGYLGMKNADSDPSRYGGKGMAIAGMILGILSFASAIIFMLFGILAG